MVASSPTQQLTASRLSPEQSRDSRDVAPFLKQLRRMLDTESARVIRWTRDGRAFEIHDMQQMTDYVLPKYFKHRKYTSFQRQLNYFNFRKWTKSKATVCTFSNECFQRDHPELAWRITRKKSVHGSSSTGAKPISRPQLPATPPSSSFSHTEALWVSAAAPVAIRVPSPASLKSCLPQPSPTDVDALAFPFSYDALEPIPHSSPVSESSDLLESLDWIDVLLPDVQRIEDDVYTPHYAAYSYGHDHHHHNYLRL
ncbi:hypothetical protein ATCC90586_007556 [Pythium insidiosum]|nr:hypothetical protein ATCC90586_007556 [Pythium insidiosum]